MPARRRVRPGPVNAPRRVPAAGPGRLIKATWAPPRLPDQPTSGSGRGGLPQPHPQVAGPQPASPPAPLSCPLRRPGEPSSAAARRGSACPPPRRGSGGPEGRPVCERGESCPPTGGHGGVFWWMWGHLEDRASSAPVRSQLALETQMLGDEPRYLSLRAGRKTDSGFLCAVGAIVQHCFRFFIN